MVDLGSLLVEAIIDSAFVITVITCEAINELLGLCEQGLNHLTVSDTVGRQSVGSNFSALRIHAHMQVARWDFQTVTCHDFNYYLELSQIITKLILRSGVVLTYNTNNEIASRIS